MSKLKNKQHALFLIIVVVLTVFSGLSLYIFRPTSIETYNKEIKGIQEAEQSDREEQKQPPKITVENKIDVLVKGETLYVTYDSGENWVKVPESLEKIQFGEYTPSYDNDLMEKSYYLTKENTSFLYENLGLKLLQTLDQGKTWQKYEISQENVGIRFRKIDFLSKDFGYVIYSGGRVARQEGTIAYLTHDGGKTWEETASTNQTSLVQDGGFVDENIGFLSFGAAPNLQVTKDGGVSWQAATIQVPEEYKAIFLVAEMPSKTGDQLELLLNQGEVGDYRGGLVKGKFISKDNGENWVFDREVEADEE
ncbi:WD40/YVTN/BNR-like repeat-containing protein [Enterococcus caccae]|uniref:Sortilin N-terminal domain-containing protein n=1 Tax=Enterococcus caccae ATCC BAA-1240 TaxID=1158612 RepID=R3WFS5_9ENTE|nr:hypothetical protein [Enterococcus caccae]EOL46317.1 hypothetical protein UC7_01284 [Enterococcus caccae ATCC BAA-1240]EOT60686.1 hypothetical protein I580_01586 [Enterococcus caccae ATCC BAA-1240]